jgi:electron transport complex protein RnfC
MVKKKDFFKTGQRFQPMEGENRYLIAPITGSIENIGQERGYLGRTYTTIQFQAEDAEEWDQEFKNLPEKATFENAMTYLGQLPGDADFAGLLKNKERLHALAILGVDQDLLLKTRQGIVKNHLVDLNSGIDQVRRITGIDAVHMVISSDMQSYTTDFEATVHIVDPVYPKTLPKMIMKDIFGKEVAAGKRCEDHGVRFISPEAVVALANAFDSGRAPIEKWMTVIGKDGKAVQVRARIGTPVKDILTACQMETAHGDRLLLGGPMTGQSIFSEGMPIGYDTDGILVQDREQIVMTSDNQCINCGECVRACPARMPVNMLVRVLENGLYDEAVKDYDLLSCIECGLCSYVCVARIQVFHYIMLGKYEFSRLPAGEETHV